MAKIESPINENKYIMGFVKWSVRNGKRLDVYSYPEIEAMIDRYLNEK